MAKQRIVVGISGASGFQYGHTALRLLRQAADVETHLVVSKGAELTRGQETDLCREEVYALADAVYPVGNLAAPIASGSFQTLGMLVAPCSMRTLAAVAHGYSDNLLTRAADVVLKERRRLVLLTRETPLNLAHLRNMTAVTEMGGIICPPVPAFYQRPPDLATMIDHMVGRVLDLFNIEQGLNPPWDPPARRDR